MLEETTETVIEKKASTIDLKNQASKITTRRTIYAAGVGLLPFPVVDVAILLGIQVVMIRDIANIYGVDYKEQAVRSIITTLVGDLGAMGVMSGIKVIPVVGPILGGFSASITGAAATYALGKIFTQHFDQGGTLLNFDPIASRKYFQEAYEEGKLYVEDLSKTEKDVKEKSSWSIFPKKKEAEVTKEDLADLRQKNDEMKEMIMQLQKSINALNA